MEKLIKELKTKIEVMNRAHKENYNLSDDFLETLYSIYPFNKFEYIISHLLGTGTLTLEEYHTMRNKYLIRNKYLYLFEITAPRSFGSWSERHLNEVVPELKRPSKLYDSDYAGQYDAWYDGIRIEVKSSRAVRRDSDGSLVSKALASDSTYGFDMNFQQMKPSCCDVFVWIAVWTDVIRYWVLSSDEVRNNRYYSPGQHRLSDGEGQLWLKETNISEFDEYEVGVREILDKIVEKGRSN